ncbi:MAG: CHRD domain-containing protein [Thermomicrobiales bacterium]|nr:CHRD domain-containing protein [Thermomicrobiales bacterium]
MASINTSGSAGSLSRSAPRAFFRTPLRVFTTFGLLTTILALVLNAAAQEVSNQATPGSTPTAQATPSAAMPRIELPLQEVNESDLGGMVTLYEFGDMTIVEFAVTGAGGDHPAAIIPGVCVDTTATAVATDLTADDTDRYELTPIDATGKSVTTIDVSLDDLLENDHAVQIVMSADQSQTTIACADIEGDPSLEPAGTPTPAESPVATPDGVGGQTSGFDQTDTDTEPGTFTVKLIDWSKTGVTGTAVLTDQGRTTDVKITLNGTPVIGGHTVHIHNGSCASPGSATYTLAPIGTDGISESTVNLTLETLTKGKYFINIHPDEENWDDWMVCGNISGDPTSQSAVTSGNGQGGTNQVGDGSGGGSTTMITTNAQAGAFPQTVGVGDGLRWPSENRAAVVMAVGVSAVILLGMGMVIRSAEKSGKHPRFTRLGL